MVSGTCSVASAKYHSLNPKLLNATPSCLAHPGFLLVEVPPPFLLPVNNSCAHDGLASSVPDRASSE